MKIKLKDDIIESKLDGRFITENNLFIFKGKKKIGSFFPGVVYICLDAYDEKGYIVMYCQHNRKKYRWKIESFCRNFNRITFNETCCREVDKEEYLKVLATFENVLKCLKKTRFLYKQYKSSKRIRMFHSSLNQLRYIENIVFSMRKIVLQLNALKNKKEIELLERNGNTDYPISSNLILGHSLSLGNGCYRTSNLIPLDCD